MDGRRARGEATRKRLMESAERVFAEWGFAAARVDEIARQAGINKRMLYLYYGDKEGIYRAVVAQNLQRLLQEVELVATDDWDDPVAQVAETIRRYFYFLVHHDALIRLLQLEMLNGGKGTGMAFEAWTSIGLNRLDGILEKGIKKGVFRPDVELNCLVMTVSTLCLGFVSRRPILESVFSDTEAGDVMENSLQHILKMVFDGMLMVPSSLSKVQS